MKGVFRWLGVPLLLALICVSVRAAGVTDLLDLCTGKNQSNCPFKVDSSGNLTSLGTGTQQLPGTVFQGTTGVVVSTLPVSGNSLGVYVPVTLAAGSANAAVEGSVLIASTSLTGVTVVVSTGAGQFSVVGIAQAAASTGAVVNMYTSGWVLALASGTVAAGDILMSSFTATGTGYLATNNSAVAYQGVAVAAGPNTSGSANLIKVKLIH